MTPTIQVMQPSWSLPDRTERLAEFWAEVDADPMYVVTVAVFHGGAWTLGGVFSTLATAMFWAHTRGLPSVVQARRLDCPEWPSIETQ